MPPGLQESNHPCRSLPDKAGKLYGNRAKKPFPSGEKGFQAAVQILSDPAIHSLGKSELPLYNQEEMFDHTAYGCFPVFDLPFPVNLLLLSGLLVLSSLARSSVTKPDQGTAVRNPFESDENNYDEDLTGQRLRRSPCKKHSAPYRYTRKDSHRQDTDVSPTHASLFSVSIRTNLCVRSRTIVVWMASHTINARLPHRSVPDFVVRIARSFAFF